MGRLFLYFKRSEINYMAQNEKILAGVLEIFRHNPQKQFRVDQIEREARR